MRNILKYLLFFALLTFLPSCGEEGGSGSSALEEDGDIINISSLVMAPPEDVSNINICVDQGQDADTNAIFYLLSAKLSLKPSQHQARLGPLTIKVDRTERAIAKWAVYKESSFVIEINGQEIETEIRDRRFLPFTCPLSAPVQNVIEGKIYFQIPDALKNSNSISVKFFLKYKGGRKVALANDITLPPIVSIDYNQPCTTRAQIIDIPNQPE